LSSVAAHLLRSTSRLCIANAGYRLYVPRRATLAEPSKLRHANLAYPLVVYRLGAGHGQDREREMAEEERMRKSDEENNLN
jgi:hypothetical protein